jgi:hypothetical protein
MTRKKKDLTVLLDHKGPQIIYPIKKFRRVLGTLP